VDWSVKRESMIVRNKTKAANRATVLVILTTAALLAWQVAAVFEDRFFAAFGTFAFVFWAMVGIWIVCVVCALRWKKRWWVLATAPVVLLPVYLYIALVVACMQGSCL
jgi:hypothetical protein